MWPFGRKKKRPPKHEHAPDTPSESQPTRTAADVLRELEEQAPPTPRAARRPADPVLGRFLLAEGPLTREYIEQQVGVGGRAASHIGRLLTQVAAPNEADLIDLLAAGYRLPDIDLKKCKVQVAVARSVPREVALKYRIVPIDRIGDILCVVFADEPNPKALQAVRRATGNCLKAFRCPAHHINILLRRLYAKAATTAPVPGPAAQATQAVPISEQEHNRIAQGATSRAEARWEGLHAGKGPVRAARIARR